MSAFPDSEAPPPPAHQSPFAADDDEVHPTSYEDQLADWTTSPTEAVSGQADGGDQDDEDGELGGFVYSGRDAPNPFAAEEEEGNGHDGDYSSRLQEVLGESAPSESATGRDAPASEASSAGRADEQHSLPAANGLKDETTPVPSSPAASRVTSGSNDEFPSLPRLPPPKRARSSLGAVSSASNFPNRPSFHPAISRLRSISTQTSASPHNRVVSSSTYNTALEYPYAASPPRRPPFGASATPSSTAFDNISRRSSTSNLFDLPSSSDLPTGTPASNASSMGLIDGVPPPARAVKWSSLKRIAGRAFPSHSAQGVSQAEQMAKSAMGQPTVMAISGLVAVGTNRGWVMVFDFSQNLRCVCGTEAIARDCGAVTAVAVSQDHTFVAVGHETGAIHLYALTKPAQPARSVPPVKLSEVLAGRKEGHLIGSRILHLGFVGARHTAIVSSDDQGLAFYHALGKVLMLASTDIIRMLGRYPDPSSAPPAPHHRPPLHAAATAPPGGSLGSPTPNDPSSPAHSPSPSFPRPRAATSHGKKPATVLDMAPLPLGPAPHPPSDALSLVALLTPTKLVVVGLKPSPRTWHRVTFPRDWEAAAPGRPFGHGQDREEVERGFAVSGVVGWWPSAKRVADDEGEAEKQKRDGGGKGKKGEEEPGEDPVLAWAWGRRVGFLRVRGLGASKAGGAGGKAAMPPPVGVEFEEVEGWTCDGPVLALRWYNERIVVILTASHFDVFDLSTRSRIGRDAHDIRAIVSHDYHTPAFYPSVPVEDTLSYSSSFTTYKRRLFLLLHDDIQAGAVLSWADRILALMQPVTILEAIELTTAYLQGQVDASTITLPDDPLERRDILEPKLREILTASLDFVFSEDRLRDGSHADGESVQRLFEGLVGTCVRACLVLDDVDWLFDELYERYEQNGIESIFLDRIEPFVLAGAVHGLPPSVSQRLIAIHAERGQLDAAQRIVWSVDPQNLDLNQVLRLCQQEKLYDALAYVYNRAMHDYVAPLVEMLALVRRIQRNRRSRPRRVGGDDDEDDGGHEYGANGDVSAETDEDVEAAAPDAYKVFAYLSQALIGLSYPKREELPYDEAIKARNGLYGFLFSGQTRAWPEKGGKSVLTSDEEGGAEPTYPYLRLLLRFDAEATLDTLDLAFEDPYLDDDEDEESTPSRKPFTRQRIVELLLEVMSPASTAADDRFAAADRTFLHIFVARNVPKYPQFLRLPPSTLRDILVSLASDPDQSTVDDRQLAAEYLLSSYSPSEAGELIPLFEEAGFFRILRSIYRGERKWADLASTYLRDPDVGSDIFAFLRETLKLATRTSEKQKGELAATILEAVPSLIQADEAGLQQTADLIDAYLPSHHAEVVERLSASSWRQFAYLRCLLEPSYADLPPTPAHASDRTPSRHLDPALRLRYLSLLCSHEPQQVVRYLETDPARLAQDEEVLRICERAEAFDAVVWAVDQRGEPAKALDHADDALETRTDLLVQQLLGGEEDEDREGDGEGTRRSPDFLLEQVAAVSAAATAVCVQRSTGRRRSKELAPEDLWFRLLSSLVSTVRSIRAIAPAPARPSDRSSSHRRISSASIVVHDDEPRQLSPHASDLLSSLIPTALSSLVSTTTSHEVSFPRLVRRLIDANSRSPAASRSYSEFKAIVSSMLDTYAFEGDLLALSTKITEQDLFEHVEEHKRQRDRGWRPGDGNPLGECAECLQPVWGPQGAGSSPPMSRSASVSLVVEAMGMNGRPRMKKRPSLKGKEVDWPEFNPQATPSGFGAPGLPPLEPPRGVVVGRDGRLWHQTCHLLRQG
ncbi:hypothetical protein JCM6882_008001 [Rhodosporidiobolus microsporus]